MTTTDPAPAPPEEDSATEGRIAAAYDAHWTTHPEAIGHGPFGHYRAGYLDALAASLRPETALRRIDRLVDTLLENIRGGYTGLAEHQAHLIREYTSAALDTSAVARAEREG